MNGRTASCTRSLKLWRAILFLSPCPRPPSLEAEADFNVFVSSLSQDLLQLQYEGVAVMKLFDRATVNVNLLIFLLNKKFYGK